MMLKSAALAASKILLRIQNKMKTIITFILLLSCGCSMQPKNGITTIPNEKDSTSKLVSNALSYKEESVLKSLINYQLKNSVPEDSEHYQFEYVFIAINGNDPMDSLIKDFSKHPRKILKLSESFSNVNGVFNKNDDKRGIVFDYKDISWSSTGLAEVEVYAFVAGRSASLTLYRLDYVNGEWVFKGSRVKVAS